MLPIDDSHRFETMPAHEFNCEELEIITENIDRLKRISNRIHNLSLHQSKGASSVLEWIACKLDEHADELDNLLNEREEVS